MDGIIGRRMETVLESNVIDSIHFFTFGSNVCVTVGGIIIDLVRIVLESSSWMVRG